MTTKEIKQWIANLIRAHRYCIADEAPELTAEMVWHNYMANSDDETVNIEDAFKASGYNLTS